MIFILQKEKEEIDLEIFILEDILKKERFLTEYIFMDLKGLENLEINEKNKNAIPVGTIPFVATWLKRFHNIENINPIEIPPCLRTEEFLKRNYNIVKAEDIPTRGRWFIKDASQLKNFSYEGNMQFFMHEDIFGKPKTKYDCSLYLDKTHLFQISEIVNVLSEYRVYFIRGEIQAISHYNGDPCILPDVNLIKKANNIYSMQKDYPKSYTMDIMVTSRGTSIIEIHDFTSCGLYNSLWGTNLLYAYRDGIDWILNHNTKPTPTTKGLTE